MAHLTLASRLYKDEGLKWCITGFQDMWADRDLVLFVATDPWALTTFSWQLSTPTVVISKSRAIVDPLSYSSEAVSMLLHEEADMFAS